MVQRTRVKICGITGVDDALSVARHGVDAIGLVFYEKSPRNITIEKAMEICHAVPAFVTLVALFMDADPDDIKQVTAQVPIDLLQFHGKETPEFCAQFGLPFIKAIGMAGQTDIEQYCNEFKQARGFLLDSHVLGKAGGSGQVFDWGDIPESMRGDIILAGGLNPGNVADAIQQVRPYAIDVSSGVESSSGVKDEQLIANFMNQVKRVDCEHE